MFERAILHLDLDAFFVSVECLKNSALRGKPIIVGGTKGKGVVAACSYEARRFGIHSAMPARTARQLCPEAIFIRGDPESYAYYSRLVTEVIAEQAPCFEKSSIDEFYLDLSGMDRYVGCVQWSKELRHSIIKASGLPISFGLSVNKTVSKVGTGEAKPNNTIAIPSGEEKQFLAPLSIRKLPSVGKQTFRKLSLMGIRRIKTLSEIPCELLQREFGKHGISLWKKANGIDNSPVVPYSEKKSISTERTFHIDTINMVDLHRRLHEMVSRLTFELRQAHKLTSCVTVKIRYSDFNTFTRQKHIPYTASDKTLRATIMALFKQLYSRRQILRLIGIRFSGLVHGNFQINLFDHSVKEIQLLKQLDGIRQRFGVKAIDYASSMEYQPRSPPTE